MTATTSSLSRLLRLFNPLRAIRDFLDVWNQKNPHRWRFFAVSAAVTFCIFSVMFAESHRIEPRPPEITIIKSLDPNRTDAQIMAENIANQERNDAAFEEQEERNRQVREIYEAIGQASGMDIERIKAEGEAERAEARRQREEAQRRALERVAQD